VARAGLARFEKRAKLERRTIVFVDESGFYLLPAVARSYAPRGQTPTLRAHLTRDHLSAISGITPSGRLFFKLQDKAFNACGVVEFLRHLLRQIPGKLLVLWDGSGIHRGRVVRAFLASPAGRRVRCERLPAYAPELIPDEWVWRHLKHVELKHVRCRDAAHLRQELGRAVVRLRRKRAVVAAFVRHVDSH
jgi:transposase